MDAHILKRLLGFDVKTMKLRTEVIAGLTTFLTMSYILSVNPTVLASTGMDKAALFTSTAIVTAIATLLMAFMAKLPFAQAPSLALNAFFAFTLVQAMGYSWQEALAAMFVEGVLFILLTFLNVRELILNSIPQNLRYAISAGIGMFIAFIGLKNAGIICSNPATFVALGPITPSVILGFISIFVCGILMAKKVKGALFFGIIIITIIGIPMGITQIPSGFMPFSAPHSLAPILWQFDFSHILSFDSIVVIFTLLIINIFDTIGTLVGLSTKANIVQKDGSIPHVKEAMLSDALATTLGAIFGCSSVTAYVESASGIAEGGRSGMASLVTGILFLIALLLSPVFLLIPSVATTGALVLVGVLMLDSILKIDLHDITEALPVFITIMMTVFTYSIADGICLGLLSYTIIKVFTGKFKDLNPTLYILSVIFLLKYVFR